MCATCGHEWTVVRWTPTAMSCPKCAGGKLGNALGLIDERQCTARRDAAEARTHVEQAGAP